MAGRSVFDTEIYPNYLLIRFRDIDTLEDESVEAVSGPLDKSDREFLRKKMARVQTVGFNSLNFDLPIVYAAIAGKTVAEIKQIAEDIIVGKMKPWHVEDHWGFKIPTNLDHIDLMEVAPGKGSLKKYNALLGGKKLQDLPYDPNVSLSARERDLVYEYCGNDLDATLLLFANLKPHLELRAKLSKVHGVDLRSKSDAQVAEAIIKKQCSKILGFAPKKPEHVVGIKFRYKAPDYIRFYSDELNDIVDKIEDHVFRTSNTGKAELPEFIKSTPVRIGGTVYSMGIGGLHSTEECVSHVTDGTFVLKDVDVESYYPSLILTLGLTPKQLGRSFLGVYRGIVGARLAAKARVKEIKNLLPIMNDPDVIAKLKSELEDANVANDGGKIMINGTFGKLGNIYSILFAPELLIAVTITGQLALLMLVERLERAGIPVVSGNTDGVVIKCPIEMVDKMKAVIAKWETQTGFKTEETEYSAIYSANVNNYIAVKKGGGVKRKGWFASSGLDAKKNPTNEICSEAVVAFLEHGTPLSKTIRGCRDISKFLTVREVKGGAIYGVREVEVERFSTKTGKKLKSGIEFDASCSQYLAKTVRFYHSTASEGAIHYKSNHNRVPKSDGCRPLMEMPDEFPSDVDYHWYIREAREMLHEIAFYEDVIGKPQKKTRGDEE